MTLTIQVKKRTTKTEPGPFGPTTVEVVTTQTVPLEPYKHWSMYTAAGNRRLRSYAEAAMKKVEAARADSFNVKKVRAALTQFVAKWELLSYSGKFGEASDTAVREVVGSFHDKLAKASGCFDDFQVQELWEKSRSSAWKKAQAIREKRKAKKAAPPSP
jgi:hypothetical protein